MVRWMSDYFRREWPAPQPGGDSGEAIMHDVQALSEAVQRNCDLSDARHARDYTLCVYLLKMRELFRWEKGLPLSQPLPGDELGEWVVARERRWESLGPEDFECVPFGRGCHDPFDAEAVNRALVPEGYVYSAGYGRFVKPHFFVGTLLRRERRDGLEVLLSGRELARDLTAPPAMLRGDTVFVRRESLRRLLWERVEEWRWQQRPDNPMGRAVASYPFEQDPELALDRMTDDEIEPTILHEIGEGRAGRVLGERWSEMVVDLACSRAEMPLRAIRDLIADCQVTLPSLLGRGTEASVHFFFANLRGHRQALFPRLLSAYRDWAGRGDASALAAAVDAGGGHWLETAEGALARHADGAGPAVIAEYVEARRFG